MYDIDKIRSDFPMLQDKKMQGKPLVYLDNASTTFKPYSVINAINKYYLEMNANSHRGDYDLCYNMDVEVLLSRKAIAKFINSEVNEVVFTSGDTESLNLVAYGYALDNLKKGDQILISETEHASNVLPWYRICELTGAEMCFLDLENNRATVNSVSNAFKKYKNIKIVALAHVGNVLGYEINAKEIASICHSNGAIFVLDGAQSVPHMPVDFKDLDVDFLSFSAHKMCGPTGIGCLVGKYDLLQKMSTFHSGGGMNVKFDKEGVIPLDAPAKFEAGTLNLSAIMGFRAAIEYLEKIGMDNIHKHDVELFDYAISKLENHDNIIIYNKDARSGIISFNIKGVFAQDEATLLNSKGIAVRSGQHCAKMIDDVIKTPATVRMSTYLYTSKEEIDIFVENLINGGDILDAYFFN
ncbi:MAG: aminotransferase class V-fold PLP-dependent enzyme [Bacilli bacterium]|nr:aminotransferase class V-fold PLP-dependent enzyme [Bacilli bacterium]